MTTYDCPVCGAYREPCDKTIHEKAYKRANLRWAGVEAHDCETCKNCICDKCQIVKPGKINKGKGCLHYQIKEENNGE
jgi:hypothetical protein